MQGPRGLAEELEQALEAQGLLAGEDLAGDRKGVQGPVLDAHPQGLGRVVGEEVHVELGVVSDQGGRADELQEGGQHVLELRRPRDVGLRDAVDGHVGLPQRHLGIDQGLKLGGDPPVL
ncbi:hypothetical protein D3C86_1479040 [compost metagenome]